MKTKVLEHIEVLVKRYPALEVVKNEIIAAYQIIEKSYKNSGKLLVAGNGGSAADAEHIVGELMKGFKLPRKTQVDFAEKIKSLELFWQKICRARYQRLRWMDIQLCLRPI